MTRTGRSRGRSLRRARTALLVLAGMLCHLTTAAEPAPATPQSGGDPRQAYSAAAPTWLRAVGTLQVPGSKYRHGRRRHYQEDCSATLVARTAGSRGDTIVTAWHCLEFYKDLSQPILFSLRSGQDPSVERVAYRVADGGGMHADWAILRLHRGIPAALVTPLIIHPQGPDSTRPISMAGYSRDSGLGQYGDQLTFDPDCLITHQTKTASDSNCAAHKGASGGAVVQLSLEGKPQFSGVISEGDSASISTFVPVGAFRSALNLHLQ